MVAWIYLYPGLYKMSVSQTLFITKHVNDVMNSICIWFNTMLFILEWLKELENRKDSDRMGSLFNRRWPIALMRASGNAWVDSLHLSDNRTWGIRPPVVSGKGPLLDHLRIYILWHSIVVVSKLHIAYYGVWDSYYPVHYTSGISWAAWAMKRWMSWAILAQYTYEDAIWDTVNWLYTVMSCPVNLGLCQYGHLKDIG